MRSVDRLVSLAESIDDEMGADAVATSAVAMAVAHTAIVAFPDELPPAEEGFHPPDLQDDALDYTTWDTSYWGAMLQSGGHPSDPSSDAIERQAFWKRYLTRTVPVAYRRYPP